jgi:dTMP kinase
MQRGKFIVFEGINGSGKTTIINSLINYYINNNIKYQYIKFPDRSSKTGYIIDKFLKNQYEFNSINDQIKIFAENRKESEQLIKNSLNDNKIILCDRYLYSNISYTLTDISLSIQNQTSNEYLSIDNIIKYDKDLLKPDLVFLINGNYINLRNEQIQERYHNNSIKNGIIFNNYLLALNYTNTSYHIINNYYNKDSEESNLDESIIKINQKINSFSITDSLSYF